MKQYVVDAFADRVFSGNPAAVCIVDRWPADALMQSIAMENNLSETAFALKTGDKYPLRWFTLGGEIDLCGHATLACAHVVLCFYEPQQSAVTFETRSGDLTVLKKGDLYEMDFPAYALTPTPVTQAMADAMGASPTAAYLGRDLLCIFDDEHVVRELSPDLEKVKLLDGLLLHVSARGRDFDCVSRSFAPKLDVAEDPVCGSGHCHIVPYWAGALQKEEIVAYQASKRGGTLYCGMQGARVKLAGKATLFSVDELALDETGKTMD